MKGAEKKMSRKYRLLALLILSVLLVLNLFPLNSTYGDPGDTRDTATKSELDADGKAKLSSNEPKDVEEGFRKAAENSHLELYVDDSTAEIAVRQKRTGEMWYSNPLERKTNSSLSVDNVQKLSSQLSFQYYNDKGQIVTKDSYYDSVTHQQYEIVPIDGGVRIVYQFGDLSKTIDEAIPKRISKERFESLILDKMPDDATRRDFKKRFRYIEEEGVYERRDTGTSFLPEVVKKYDNILQSIGYTAEELAYDHAENQIEATAAAEKEVFVIPIEYRLDQDNLVVKVPMNEVSHPSKLKIQSISLLKYFGAADQHAQGYMLVPDGSGALIHLNNGKLSSAAYQSRVYGDDRARQLKENMNRSEVTRLPVFGLKQGNHAFFAIIENGDAIAGIEADIAGKVLPYNYVGANFTTLPKDELTISGGWNSNTVAIFPTQMVLDDLVIRYAFLNDEAASYAGMAGYYRNYLVQRYGMTKLEGGGETPFYLELAGAVTKRKSFLGIPYSSIEPLTTYEQAQTIVNQLQQSGVNQIQLRYTGWFNGGYQHSIPTKVKPEQVLGSTKQLRAFAAGLQEQEVGFYPDAALTNVYRNTWGFSPSSDAARFINKKPAKLYPYNPATFQVDKEKSAYYALSPAKLPGIVDAFLGSFGKLELSGGGISLRDLGDELNSDFRDSATVHRQQSKEITEQQLSRIRQELGKPMVIGGNAYALPYAGHILEAPMRSSGFDITDESIPFYQMVLHGYADYAGKPANLSGNQDLRLYLLKCLETGSNAYFSWFYAPASTVKDTEFDWMYSSHYETWLSEAAAMYKELNEALAGVRDQIIIDHSKLAEGVYATVYENGQRVVVNYNAEPYTENGLTVNGYSYAIGGGTR